MAGLSDFLPEPQVRQLEEHAITSVDDLYVVLQEDPQAVSDMLNLNEDETGELDAALRSNATTAVVDALDSEDDSPRPLDPASGADDQWGSDSDNDPTCQ